ncbi:thiamine pyrophosphate-dependent enzyme [Desulfatirhabdium butyrativorans]|uniref:thiamine pyrophosphate-dependent enzyme n=1 Tax=Desulfatirhabdium butyrativorans TaxID=340467 RepID=UPI000420CBDF|nr:thiamine pyrophosphate-dependent enzyme [Desulfatirhabdium butyrativorans]
MEMVLGNQAIAYGLAENGCQVATSYPGTPASEILPGLASCKVRFGMPQHVQWAVNEKVAFEIAYAAAMSGLRAAVSMKQVGLNVASDPFMSAAYMGTTGGFVVISADDPGPHSSQTEQDSRMMAMLAQVPVLDPATPLQAREMTALAFTLSEAFQVPVMLRPTTRVCHSRQNIELPPIQAAPKAPVFEKNPLRWAATPKYRLILHRQLIEKLSAIATYPATAPIRLNPEVTPSGDVIVTSGVVSAYTEDLLKDIGLWDRVACYQVLQPYPLHREFVSYLRSTYRRILVLEETMPVIEMQLADRDRVLGRLDGTVPSFGELVPEVVESIVRGVFGMPRPRPDRPQAPGKRPTLCPGCPHRASFFAIRKAAPKAIFTSDIGCYTLGLNLGAVDTVLCMGAAIGQAAGFYQAHRNHPKPPDIIATIGDSTFFHAGLPALVDAVVQQVRFVLVILDNRTTAMTGNQPTPASGFGAGREPLETVDIESLVRGCGVGYCRTADPVDIEPFVSEIRQALSYAREHGPAVVIARHPCVLHFKPDPSERRPVRVSEDCDGCGFCVQRFECPALVLEEGAERVRIDRTVCSDCGVCVQVCPKQALVVQASGASKGRDHAE